MMVTNWTGGMMRILLVDPESDKHGLSISKLREQHTVILTTRPEEALDFIVEADPFDVVLSGMFTIQQKRYCEYGYKLIFWAVTRQVPFVGILTHSRPRWKLITTQMNKTVVRFKHLGNHRKEWDLFLEEVLESEMVHSPS